MIEHWTINMIMIILTILILVYCCHEGSKFRRKFIFQSKQPLRFKSCNICLVIAFLKLILCQAQEVDNDGVDFTELSWAAALLSCSCTEQLKLTRKMHVFVMPPDGRQSEHEYLTTWVRIAFHHFVGRQLTAIYTTIAYIMCDVWGHKQSRHKKWRTVTGKGRGFVYACQNRLYRQVKKEGNVRYMKCCMEPCDRLMKLQNGEFKVGVCLMLKYPVGRHVLVKHVLL